MTLNFIGDRVEAKIDFALAKSLLPEREYPGGNYFGGLSHRFEVKDVSPKMWRVTWCTEMSCHGSSASGKSKFLK